VPVSYEKIIKMNHASLCSGIGGFDLAAEWMGWNNIFAVEKDEACQKVLRKNFSELKLYDDLYKFNGVNYEGTIDIISAGFPCQPFSVAGKQKGKEDDRHLWPEVLRIVKEIKPTFFLGENVPGIISLALDEVLSDLESEGYACQTFIIPACAVNAIHRRDRVWIIAYSHANGEMRRSRIDERTSREEGVQERNQIQFPSQSSELSSSVSPDSEHNGSQNRPSVERRAFGESETGRLLESQGKDSRINPNTKYNGFTPPEEQRSIDEAIHKEQNGKRIPFDFERISCLSASENYAPNSDNIGLRRHQRKSIQEGSTSCSGPPPNQSRRFQRITYPISQPTIRRGDDGISYRLDNGCLISPKQRTESLKQLGNAIVPQVAYKIFKIISSFIKEND
jgi:DNA (cytosine-5)-methyltransferase 1